MRKLPPLNALRAFEAAARHVSFTHAAAELGVTHGAISRQVAGLEAWLGQALFVRAPSHLQLTDVGRKYLAEVGAALDRISLASVFLRHQAAPKTLRVSAPPTFAMRWLIPRLSGFQRRRPDVEIQLLTSRAPVNFSQDLYDIAIRGVHERPEGCTAIRLGSELILPACHTDIVEHGSINVPQHLANQTLISYSTEPYTWREWFESAGMPNLRPAGHLKFEELFYAVQAALDGLGVVLVPLFLVIDDIVAEKMAAPFGSLGVWRRDYYACHRPKSTLDGATEDFCAWLLAEFGDTERSISDWSKAAAFNLS